VFAFEDICKSKKRIGILVSAAQPCPMVKVGASGQIKFGEEFWQPVVLSQGVNQPGLLLVAQERQVDAQAFFSSSFAFFKRSCSSCNLRMSR
jgi:hypothetical protein